MNKKIANVVFYKFWDPTREEAMQQACIFYDDGTVQNTTLEDGLEAAYQVANAEKLTGQQFRTALNREKFYTMSGAEFERRFQEFVRLSREEVATAVNAEMVKIQPTRYNNPTRTIAPSNQTAPVRANTQNGQTVLPPRNQNNGTPAQQNNAAVNVPTGSTTPGEMTEADRAKVIENIQKIRDQKAREAVAQQVAAQQAAQQQAADYYKKPQPQTGTRTSQSTGGQPQQTPTNNGPAIPTVPIVVPTGTTSSNTRTASTDPQTTSTTPRKSRRQRRREARQARREERKRKRGNKPSLWERIKKSRVGQRITALFVAAALLVGGGIGGYHLGKNSKSGPIVSSNIALQQVDDNQVQDAAYNKLLKQTKDKDLKAIMTKQGQNLDMYNRDFAKKHVESGKEVKAALTWDEVVALNLAYNDYTPEQIRLMFNGSNVSSVGLSHAYKNAQLQLMGAYVISDRENAVNMSNFVTDEEGKKFVEKYENLFYDCKEATGDARVAAVNKFYQELFKDFPISDDVREVGLSHADGRKQVKNYMSAVAPMVAASEIMWQNLKIDHTLSNKATAYFNDIGLCNLAEDSFERVERITEVAEVNKKVPTYEEFMKTKMMELQIEENYVTNDAHRDLSQLDAFQKWVNGHFTFDKDGYNTGKITYNKKTVTNTTYRNTSKNHTTSSRDEAVKEAGENAVKKAEDKLNQQINKDNATNKANGESAAEDKRQELQDQADKDAGKLQDQVNKDDQDFQDKINDANNNINNGGTVNEDDLGHGIDFDKDHSDNNGNLNDNIGDITTDGSGSADHNDPLPDPNETGQNFDQRRNAPANNYFSGNISSYEETYAGQSNEDIVDQMIRDMENQQGPAQTAKVYTKK